MRLKLEACTLKALGLNFGLPRLTAELQGEKSHIQRCYDARHKLLYVLYHTDWCNCNQFLQDQEHSCSSLRGLVSQLSGGSFEDCRYVSIQLSCHSRALVMLTNNAYLQNNAAEFRINATTQRQASLQVSVLAGSTAISLCIVTVLPQVPNLANELHKDIESVHFDCLFSLLEPGCQRARGACIHLLQQVGVGGNDG